MPVSLSTPPTKEILIQEIRQEVPEAEEQEVAEVVAAAMATEAILGASPDTVDMATKVHQEVINLAKQAKRKRLKLVTIAAAKAAQQFILKFGG